MADTLKMVLHFLNQSIDSSAELMGTEKTFACMKAAYDAGVNFFDTAEGYAGGQSEIVMGKAIKHFGWKQRDLVISTKVPFVTPSLFISETLTDWCWIALLRPRQRQRPPKPPQQPRPFTQTHHRRPEPIPRSP